MNTIKESPQKLSRRKLLKLGGLAAGAVSLGVGCAAFGVQGAERASQHVDDALPVAPITVKTPSGLKVHGIQTGWISIKQRHYRMRGPEALKELAILTDTRWTEPKPILSWVMEHPEGLIVIDSGERAGARDLPTYLACADAGSRYFISRNFRLNVTSESELGPQLERLNLSTGDVRWCIQTHLHFDHANGFAFLPEAEVLVSRAELNGQRARPMGAVACTYPPGFAPTAIDYKPQTFGVFSEHYPLTTAGDVLIVPTPGHSYGHQSVVLLDGEQTLFFAGDVVYDERQLNTDEVSGINVGVAATRSSMERVRAFIAEQPTVFLPSHDPQSLTRLASLQTIALPRPNRQTEV